jgi:hypothetical protein
VAEFRELSRYGAQQATKLGINVEDPEVVNRIIHEDEGKGKKTGLKVILDTNVYISAFHFPEGVCAQLVEYVARQRPQQAVMVTLGQQLRRHHRLRIE